MDHRDGERQRLATLRPALEMRACLLEAVRAHFRRDGYLDVSTPALVPTPALELHIDAMRAGNGYLRTSPELHMKRLLCAGYGKIFQIGPCFRAGESGALHNPEFTMLEWYQAGAGYMDALAETQDLLCAVARECLGHARIERRGAVIELEREWAVLSVSDLFLQFAGWDPAAAYDERRFEDDLVNRVEPNLPAGRPAVLKDYPAAAAALARLKPGDPLRAERWELYLGGVEIANAFSELADAVEQRKRFEDCALKRTALGKEAYKMDREFLAALEGGMPPSAGVALGIDRLVMLFAGAASLDNVMPFR